MSIHLLYFLRTPHITGTYWPRATDQCPLSPRPCIHRSAGRLFLRADAKLSTTSLVALASRRFPPFGQRALSAKTLRNLTNAVEIASLRAGLRNVLGSDRRGPSKIGSKSTLENHRTGFSHSLRSFAPFAVEVRNGGFAHIAAVRGLRRPMSKILRASLDCHGGPAYD